MLVHRSLLELVDCLNRGVGDKPGVLKHAICLALLDQLLQVSAVIEVRRFFGIFSLLFLQDGGGLLRLSGKIIRTALNPSDLHFHLPNLLFELSIADLVQIDHFTVFRFLVHLDTIVRWILLLQIMLASTAATFQIHIVSVLHFFSISLLYSIF